MDSLQYKRQALADDYYQEESWRCCTDSMRDELSNAAWSWAVRLSPERVQEYFRDLQNKYRD